MLSHTPMPSSTMYSTPTATSQTKNNATPSTSDSLSTDHGSIRLTCRFALLGPLPGLRNALTDRSEPDPAPPGAWPASRSVLWANSPAFAPAGANAGSAAPLG